MSFRRGIRFGVTVLGILILGLVLIQVVSLGLVAADTWASRLFVGSGSDDTFQQLRIRDVWTPATQMVGGSAVAIGVVYSARTYSVTRKRAQVARLMNATEQIASDRNVASRTAGVYNLGHLVEEDPATRPLVQDVLCALVRDSARGSISNLGRRPKSIGADIQAALLVLGALPSADGGRRGGPVVLRGAQVPGARLKGQFHHVSASRADLRSCNATDADLAGADLRGSKLDKAVLANTVLAGADLRGASMKGANVYRTQFGGADLDGVDMREVEELTQDQVLSMKRRPSQLPPYLGQLP